MKAKHLLTIRTLACRMTLLLALMLGFSSIGLTQTVATDKLDYSPGETVMITGTGFQSGEQVVLSIIHINIDEYFPVHFHDAWTVTADSIGNFSSTWYVDAIELNTMLYLTATGQSSGLSASTTFTDAAKATTTTLTSSLNPSIFGNSVTFTATIDANGKVNCGTVKFTIDGTDITPQISLSDSKATYSISSLSIGSHNVVATYYPASSGCNYLSSTSATLAQTVNGAPSFTSCPGNLSANTASGLCPAVATYTATATGTPAPTLAYAFTGVTIASGTGTGSGSTFNKGVTTVTITASNGYLPNATCSFTVTVNDNVKPALADVPVDATVNCESIPSVGSPSASDNCDAAPIVHYLDEVSSQGSDPLLASFYNYTLTRTWDATDASGNHSLVGTQVITVHDVTIPVLADVPVDATVNCESIPPVGSPSASDNCDTAPIVHYLGEVSTKGSDPLLPSFYNYTLTRTWDATDASDNHSLVGTQVITVHDVSSPTITPASSSTVECDGSGNTAQLNAWLNNHGGATATDNCSDVSWSNNFTALSDGCGASGSVLVKFTVTDVSGNESSASATFTIMDTTDPSITTPASNLNPPHLSGNVATWLTNHGGAVATDVCGNVTWTHNFPGFDICSTDPFPVTFTATDACGNISTTTASIIQPSLLTATIAPLPTWNLFPTCAFGASAVHIFKGYNNSVQFNTSVSGGTQTYSYSWSPVTGLSNPNIANPVFNPVMAQGTCQVFHFTLTVTDANGCVATTTVDVKALNTQVPNTNPGSKYTICHNINNYVDINVSVNALPAHFKNNPGDCVGSCMQQDAGGCEPAKVMNVFNGDNPWEDIFLLNYPNPFSSKTTILFLLPTDNKVKLEVYDLTGKLLETLFDGDVYKEQEYSVEFDGAPYTTGMYIYKLTTNNNVATGKMMLNKQE